MTNAVADNMDELQVDEEMDENEAAVKYDITSYPSDLTLSVVYEMWNNGDIFVPEFQRNFVWTIKQSSLLIESFLLGLPVPQVFFYVDEANKNQVIDGHQRIMSVVSYIDGYFGSESIQGKRQVFRLQGLDDRSPFARKRFDELDDVQQRKLKGAVLRATNIRQMHPKGEPTSVYHIFERLNTGGTPLKPQEIRNCVFRGKFSAILRDLNLDNNWRGIIGKQNLDKHQKDIELILRVFALSFYFDEYDKPLKEFLNRIMSRERSGNSQTVKTFVTRFRDVAGVVVSAIGKKPFHLRGPLNSAALDSVMASLIMAKKKLPHDIGERYAKLARDQEFEQYTFYSTSDLAVVRKRFEVVQKLLLK